MKKIILLLSFLFLFVGCDTSNDTISYVPDGKKKKFQVYKVGIHPYLNSAKTYALYRPLFDYFEDHLEDVQLVLETSTSYADYEEKLYRGDFDFSLPNPYQTLYAIENGYIVIAKMKPDEVFRGIFVTRKDNNLKDINEIKNSTISFPAPTALAASMMPLYFLHLNGIDINKDIKKKYVGSQISSILNAYSKDTLLGATWPPPWEIWKKENPEKAQEMEVIWQTKPLINNSIVVKNNIDNNIVAQIATLLVSCHTKTKCKKLLDNAGFEGFSEAKNCDYDVVKDFLKKYNKLENEIR